MDKLATMLRRDAAANPTKTAVLGVMALVALYFWAPLVWRWLAPTKSKPTVRGVTVGLILTDDPSEPQADAKNRSVTKFRWEKVRQLIQQDSRMAPAALEATWHDPFKQQAAKEPDPTDQPAVAQATVTEIGPAEAGLTLTSIAIGPRRRTAVVNGDTYREGDVISAGEKEKGVSDLSFRVLKINRDGIELQRGERTFQLQLSKPTLAKGDEIGRRQEK